MIRLLVCGGREYEDAAEVNSVLDRVHAERGIATIIEGGARGADRLARAWAIAHSVPVVTFDAEWEKYGKAAGRLRNAEMLRRGEPDGVVAFPGGAGTADMIRRAEYAGVGVWDRSRKNSMRR